MATHGINSLNRRRLRKKLSESQNHRCCYNGCDLRGDCTLEHVINVCDDGSNRWDNLVAACRECNNRRSRIEAIWKVLNGLPECTRRMKTQNRLFRLRNLLREEIEKFGMENWLFISTFLLTQPVQISDTTCHNNDSESP